MHIPDDPAFYETFYFTIPETVGSKSNSNIYRKTWSFTLLGSMVSMNAAMNS